VQGNQYDFNDAATMLEATRRSRTRSVSLKSIEQ
jgi:hypothetical protein